MYVHRKEKGEIINSLGDSSMWSNKNGQILEEWPVNWW